MLGENFYYEYFCNQGDSIVESVWKILNNTKFQDFLHSRSIPIGQKIYPKANIFQQSSAPYSSTRFNLTQLIENIFEIMFWSGRMRKCFNKLFLFGNLLLINLECIKHKLKTFLSIMQSKLISRKLSNKESLWKVS